VADGAGLCFASLGQRLVGARADAAGCFAFFKRVAVAGDDERCHVPIKAEFTYGGKRLIVQGEVRFREFLRRLQVVGRALRGDNPAMDNTPFPGLGGGFAFIRVLETFDQKFISIVRGT
jgi:hypothetical protein